ncbi:MAG: sulfite exporter TauE/SafE family protein [Clostridia bacterium]|nr:sulfite exporter TauE/SafE family protein [Clostridia bacterium]
MAFYIILSSFLSGLLCSMGFGGGTVMIIFLTGVLSLEQTRAQGINLMFFIPCAVYSLIIYARNKLIDKSKVIPLAVGGVTGIAIGYFLLQSIPAEYLSKLFGGFVVILGVKQLFSLKNKAEKRK